MDSEITPVFSVLIQEPLVRGMLDELCLGTGYALQAINVPGIGTRLEYLPYYIDIKTGKLIEVPETERVTRAVLLSQLKEYGFQPHSEG